MGPGGRRSWGIDGPPANREPGRVSSALNVVFSVTYYSGHIMLYLFYYRCDFLPSEDAFVFLISEQVPGKFRSIVGQDPSDSKSNRLHVDIFRFFFHSFVVHSTDYSKVIGKFPQVFNQGSERLLGVTGGDPSVCKSNRLHVLIRWFSFIKLRYIL